MHCKACRKCGAEKPLADFYAHKQMADGHLNICKECTKTRVSAFQKARTLKATNAYGEMADRKVSYTASNAIRDGKLVKSPCCTAPGCFSTDRIEGHHPDFSKPLAVVWLCKECHKTLHKEYRRMKHV